MKDFYERRREENAHIHCSRSRPHTYPAHFHQNLELYIIRSGEYTLDVNGEKIVLSAPSLAVIDSYEVHTYIGGTEGADDCTVVIPYRYLERFNLDRGNRAIAERVLSGGELVDRLLSIIDGYIIPDESEAIVDAGVALLLAVLLSHLRLSDKSERGESALIRRVLRYIQENYRSDVSRGKIAAALGYAEAHISRVFHRYMRRGISDYVAALRLAYVEERRRAGDGRTLTELVFDAGFGSMESYYRNKRRLSGGR